MKIIIQEYEEDPTTSLENNNNNNNNGNIKTAPVMRRSIEYNLDKNNNIINNKINTTTWTQQQQQQQQQHLQVQLAGASTDLLTPTNTTGISSSSSSSSSSFVHTIISTLQIWKSTMIRIAVQLFLPIGYPHSVDESYLTYQLYDALQGLCSYWRGVVSTKAVLQATGVGNANATAASAALQWALRDGMGMMGGLVFSFVCSHHFDVYVKEFRLFADIINDVALTLDMIAPYFTTSTSSTTTSLYILSLSTLCKTMCGMSAGATKGRISQHFAQHNGNMADLTAKESTQETLVSLLGMMGGIFVAKSLESSSSPFWMTWMTFGLLTFLHVWSNYKGVLQLQFTTLNPERTRKIFQHVVEKIILVKIKTYPYNATTTTTPNTMIDMEPATATTTTNSMIIKDYHLPSPKEISESLWSSLSHFLFPTLHVGQSTVYPHTLQYLSEFANQKYVIGIDNDNDNNASKRRRRHVYIWLRVGAEPIDELQAFVHGLVLQECLSRNVDRKGDEQLSNATLIRRTLMHVQTMFETNDIWQLLTEKGWDMQSRLYLGFSQTRIQWNIKDE